MLLDERFIDSVDVQHFKTHPRCWKGYYLQVQKEQEIQILGAQLKKFIVLHTNLMQKKKKNGLWSYLAAVRFDAVEYDLVLILPLLALAPCSFWRFMLYSSVAMMYDLPQGWHFHAMPRNLIIQNYSGIIIAVITTPRIGLHDSFFLLFSHQHDFLFHQHD